MDDPHNQTNEPLPAYQEMQYLPTYKEVYLEYRSNERAEPSYIQKLHSFPSSRHIDAAECEVDGGKIHASSECVETLALLARLGYELDWEMMGREVPLSFLAKLRSRSSHLLNLVFETLIQTQLPHATSGQRRLRAALCYPHSEQSQDESERCAQNSIVL